MAFMPPGAGYDRAITVFSPDGKHIGFCYKSTRGANFGVYSHETGWYVNEYTHTFWDGGVLALAFFADGRTIAGITDTQIIKLWDIESGKEIRRFRFVK